MTGLPEILDELAGQARYYDVVDAAVRAGQRRDRIRRWSAVGGAATVALVLVVVTLTGRPRHAPPVTPAPVFPTSCAVAPMPLPPGIRSGFVARTDRTGRFAIGSFHTSNADQKALFWDGDAVTVVPIPGTSPVLVAIDSHGEAVGNSTDAHGTPASWYYHDGRLTRLRGHSTEALGLNDRHEIVGDVAGHPAVWRTPDSEPELLSMPPGHLTAFAAAVGDDGTIVATVATDPTTTPIALRWAPDGTRTELRPVPTDLPRSGAFVRWIRDGRAIGGSDGWSDTTSTIWDLATGEPTAEIPFSDINRYGWTVRVDEWGLTLHDGSRELPLPRISGQLVRNAYVSVGPYGLPASISDSGLLITGTVSLADGSVPVRWTCH